MADSPDEWTVHITAPNGDHITLGYRGEQPPALVAQLLATKVIDVFGEENFIAMAQLLQQRHQQSTDERQ